MNPRNIGISLGWEACLPLARDHGFEGIDVPVDPKVSAAQYRDALAQYNLLPGGMALPYHPSDSDAKVEEALAKLPALAERAREVGQTRFYIWIHSFSDSMPWKENFRFHVDRLGKAASILEANGCRLGLEFLGPRSLREGHRYSFIHTMESMLDLCEAIGPNAGLLLDAYHWYTSLGTLEELRTLENQQVVYVHINDAPAGVALEKQQDLVRCLPGETGTIDLAGFFDALTKIGYDGPVVPEPFVKSLSEMPPAEAARRVSEAILSVWPRG
jgi:sugar phosphate isomerase/epimerase